MKKNVFKKIASLVITLYANHVYRKAVRQADNRHVKERTRIYVIPNPFDYHGLATCNRRQFRKIKELTKNRDPRFSTTVMKSGAYYHTADGGGHGTMEPCDMESRRIAFIRETLRAAKLHD